MKAAVPFWTAPRVESSDREMTGTCVTTTFVVTLPVTWMRVPSTAAWTPADTAVTCAVTADVIAAAIAAPIGPDSSEVFGGRSLRSGRFGSFARRVARSTVTAPVSRLTETPVAADCDAWVVRMPLTTVARFGGVTVAVAATRRTPMRFAFSAVLSAEVSPLSVVCSGGRRPVTCVPTFCTRGLWKVSVAPAIW